MPLADRLWAHVEKGDGCWNWTASCDDFGYGRLGGSNGVAAIRAHRLSWLLHFGTIPDELFVLHHCDNPACVRPDHLFLGTNETNMKDMTRKGRSRTGERHPKAKLTESQVREIRRRSAAGEASNTELALEHGVSQPIISYIVNRITWRHI